MFLLPAAKDYVFSLMLKLLSLEPRQIEALNILGVVTISSRCVGVLWLAFPMTYKLKLLSATVAASFIRIELKILPECTSNRSVGTIEFFLAEGFLSGMTWRSRFCFFEPINAFLGLTPPRAYFFCFVEMFCSDSPTFDEILATLRFITSYTICFEIIDLFVFLFTNKLDGVIIGSSEVIYYFNSNAKG